MECTDCPRCGKPTDAAKWPGFCSACVAAIQKLMEFGKVDG